jgi:hypothetical protein
MLENAMREPWEDVIERIRQILSNSRRLRENIRRAGINQPIANIKWDTPDWPITTAVTPVNPSEHDIPDGPITTAVTPVNPSEHDIPQPIFPIFWLIIILIIPLIVAMLYAHFLCKQGVNMIWLRYLISQLPFIGSVFVLLFLLFTWNPHLIQLVSILTVVVLVIVLLLEEIVLLVYITRQYCDTDCEESTTEIPNHISES